ncbi:unnamed protein product [Rhizophagus irregularis]|nr:unnamed protein product [Rhizophagus irregularis]
MTTDGVLNAIRTTNEIHQHNLLSLLPAGYSPKVGLNSDEQNTKSDISSEYTPSTLLDSSSEYTPSDESGEDDVILVKIKKRTDLHQKESNCSSPAKPENTELNEKYSDESFDKNESDNIENGQFEKESNHSDHALGKRQNTSHHEEGRIPKKQHKDKYTTPSCEAVYKRQMESSMGIDDQFFSEEINIISIDDIPCELSFVNENLVDDFKIKEINVSMLFRQYQNKSVDIAKTGGLLVESNTHEILSLSSILLLIPDSHSKTMINIFGSPLLNEIYQQFVPAQQPTLNLESELKFREVIKRAIKESWSSVKKWWLTELANDQTLDENLGFVILECLKSLPTAKIKNEPSETTLITNYLDHVMKGMLHDPNKYIVEWPNTGLDESKARKSGRSKQPDFVVSVIHQLQTSGVIFVGEVSPPSEKNNVYKNCNDLIRIGVFMKDCLDSAIDLGADIKTLGFQCVDYTVDFYMMDIILQEKKCYILLMK